MLYINIHFKQTCCNGHRASLLTCNKQGVIPLIYGRNIKQAVDSERNTRLKWHYANCALKCERGSRVAFNISSLFTRVAQQNRLPQSTPAYCTKCHNPLEKKKKLASVVIFLSSARIAGDAQFRLLTHTHSKRNTKKSFWNETDKSIEVTRQTLENIFAMGILQIVSH